MNDINNAIELTPAVSKHDHTQGPANAPITLVEYGDFECPYCREGNTTVKRLQQQFGERLRFVFRNYPLIDTHPHAEHAAEAAEAAASQGKFWEMHDLLFQHQQRLDDAHLVTYAEQLHLDKAVFVQAMEEGTYTDRVMQDVASGDESGVEATPTFFINSRRYEGSLDRESIAQAIDSMLQKR